MNSIGRSVGGGFWRKIALEPGENVRQRFGTFRRRWWGVRALTDRLYLTDRRLIFTPALPFRPVVIYWRDVALLSLVKRNARWFPLPAAILQPGVLITTTAGKDEFFMAPYDVWPEAFLSVLQQARHEATV